MSEDNTSEGIAPMCRRAQFGQFLVGDFNGDGKPDLIQAGTTYYAKLGDVDSMQMFRKVEEAQLKKKVYLLFLSVYKTKTFMLMVLLAL